MRFSFLSAAVAATVLGLSSAAVLAQNVAIVNGKAVPKSRLNMLAAQVERSGRSVTPDMEQQLREEVIMREVFMQEAEKQGLEGSDDYKIQLEIAKQSILIRELFAQFQKANPVSDADVKAEYDKFVASSGGKEYRSRHILVEKEEQAKAIIASLKKGGKFEDIAKKQSKDPGSGANGGDLD
jgi:peptidyl-prolyl cis-trans isomerase C